MGGPLRSTSAEVVSHVLNRARARRTLFEDGRKKGIEDEKWDRPNFQREKKRPQASKNLQGGLGGGAWMRGPVLPEGD